jgi:hypothetical protein
MAFTMEAIVGAVFYDSNMNHGDCERVTAVLGLTFE